LPTRPQASLIYDGGCPFCNRYVQLLRLREHLDLQLIDARQKPEDYHRLLAEGVDLDLGMVLELHGATATQTYHGADCIHRLALLSSASNWFNRFNNAVFRRPALSALIYPVLVRSRNLLLRILRRTRLADR
jgi:predicted DCC family thiol-disulfide oxidoreductase YuxK